MNFSSHLKKLQTSLFRFGYFIYFSHFFSFLLLCITTIDFSKHQKNFSLKKLQISKILLNTFQLFTKSKNESENN